MLTDAEKVLFKAELHRLIDTDIPAIIAVEEEKLPDTYKGMVKLIVGAVLPQVEAALDAKIEAAFTQPTA